MRSPNPAELRVGRAYDGELVSRADREVAQLATEEHGVLAVDDLRACGLTQDAIDRRARRGHLHLLHRGVYAVGHTSLSNEGVWLAAVKACGPAAVLSHLSAGALHRYIDWRADEMYPEVTVLGKGTRRHRGIRVHTTDRLDPRDVRRINGIRVTSPARTVVDLAGSLSYQALRSAVSKGLSVGACTVSQILEVMIRLGPRRGSRNLRSLLASKPAPARSVLENVVLDVIREAGIGEPDVNKPIWIEGRRVIPDFRWPTLKLIVEADGKAWHDNPAAREADAERQALLEAHGEQVLRVTWDQALLSRVQTASRIRAAASPPTQLRDSRANRG